MATEFTVVCGAGGFIGGHLVANLLHQGRRVRAVDLKPFAEWWQRFDDAENLQLDLRDKTACDLPLRGAHTVFNLAADMGGVGYIETQKVAPMLSVLINTHLLLAARQHGVARYFFASSACVYPVARQAAADAAPLRESDAYPAEPMDGYGWEKLFGERLCRHFREECGLPTRAARFHNTYGPHGAFDGGREKAPAAICRKVIQAKLSGRHEIEIWGDGTQTRSFTYVDDCVKGLQLITASDITEPLNLGSSELVTINQLVAMAEELAGVKLKRNYLSQAPKGVTGRNSDNTLIKELLGWEPQIKLRDGLEKTYRWIHDEW
jgi:nucleoside-diphosphate-sugar epimerase